MWTFMKENKSEWAAGGGGGGRGRADPTRQAPGHPLNLTLLPGPCPGHALSGSPVDQAALQLGSHRVVGQSGGRIHAPTRPSVPSCPPVLDMQQTYDMWLKKHNPGSQGKAFTDGSREEGRSRSRCPRTTPTSW